LDEALEPLTQGGQRFAELAGVALLPLLIQIRHVIVTF
jgi:hypothetical protein